MIRSEKLYKNTETKMDNTNLHKTKYTTPAAKPGTYQPCFHITIYDFEDENKYELEPDSCFTMKPEYWENTPYNLSDFEFKIQDIFKQIIEETPQAYLKVYSDLDELPPGSTVPLTINNDQELKEYLYECYSSCIGWMNKPHPLT